MLWIWQVLMITARMVGGQAYPEKIEEMDRELTKVIEDFSHAVDVEALHLAKKNGKPLIHCGQRPAKTKLGGAGWRLITGLYTDWGGTSHTVELH